MFNTELLLCSKFIPPPSISLSLSITNRTVTTETKEVPVDGEGDATTETHKQKTVTGTLNIEVKDVNGTSMDKVELIVDSSSTTYTPKSSSFSTSQQKTLVGSWSRWGHTPSHTYNVTAIVTNASGVVSTSDTIVL